VVFQFLYLKCEPWGGNGIRLLAYAVLMPGLVHALEAEPVIDSIVYLRIGLLLFIVMKVIGETEAKAGREALAIGPRQGAEVRAKGWC